MHTESANMDKLKYFNSLVLLMAVSSISLIISLDYFLKYKFLVLIMSIYIYIYKLS